MLSITYYPVSLEMKTDCVLVLGTIVKRWVMELELNTDACNVNGIPSRTKLELVSWIITPDLKRCESKNNAMVMIHSKVKGLSVYQSV